MTGSSWLLLALAGGAQAAEFQLDTDTPDALCPELSMTREAVRQRLGQLETEAGSHWRGSYSTVHDPSGRRGAYVRLVIRAAEGKEQLTRELPLKGESCDTLAQAIALVVDGFFRELAHAPDREPATASEQAVPSVTGAPQASATRVTPAEPDGTKTHVAGTESLPHGTGNVRDKGLCRLALALGAAYESVPSSGALHLGAILEPHTRWQLQLRGSLPTSSRADDNSAAAAAYLIPVRLGLGYVAARSARLRWLIGPELLVSLESGFTRGIPEGHDGWRASVGLGAETGLAYWVTDSVALAGGLSVDQVLVQGRRFLMYEQPVLEFPRSRLSGTLGFWAVILP